LPFIQCHQTCGRAAGGGERKAERSWSSPAAPATAAANTAIIENTIREIKESKADTEKTETCNTQTHDRAASERNSQRLDHAALFSCSSCTDVALGRDLHTEETGQDGQQCTEDVQTSCQRRDRNGDQDSQHHDDDDHEAVFLGQERHRAFMDVTGDLLHPVIARITACDPFGERECNDQRDHSCDGGQNSK
jgi:hypothetical protein